MTGCQLNLEFTQQFSIKSVTNYTLVYYVFIDFKVAQLGKVKI